MSSKIRKARKLLEQGDEEARASADELFREAERAYDWQSLYERLVRLKRRVPEAEVLKLGGVSDVPFGFLMRIMDVARYELEQETFESSESFRRALWNGETAMVDGEDGKKPKSMFDIVVVASPVR